MLDITAELTSRIQGYAVGYWIGFYRDEGEWLWTDNSDIGFTYWAPDQPPSYNGVSNIHQ